jgi:3-hydroxy acid dehydrogenase/malonic semialdehyde reductase
MNIFITGATSGFGLSMATKFLNQGHFVIAVGRRVERLDDLKKKFNETLLVIKCDIQNKEEVSQAIDTLPNQFKKIDVLINNAGLAMGTSKAQDSKIEDWETMIQTNINGVLYCTKKILPLMVKENNGMIINLGSVAGEFPYLGGNVYGASKAFIHQFSMNLRSDLLGTKIRVTNIEPGMCETEFSLVRFNGDEDKAKSVYQGMKPLTADDIADTIDWIIHRPPHVNINNISLMPVDQAFAGFTVNRK